MALKSLQYEQRYTEISLLRIERKECLRRKTHEMAQQKANIENIIVTREQRDCIAYLPAFTYNFLVSFNLENTDQTGTSASVKPSNSDSIKQHCETSEFS